MDKLIDELMIEHNLSESEALVVLGILGMSALDTENIHKAINTVDNKLKNIAIELAMA